MHVLKSPTDLRQPFWKEKEGNRWGGQVMHEKSVPVPGTRWDCK